MGRKAIYTTHRIDTIEKEIAMLELTYYDEWAQGIRYIFKQDINEQNIEAHKKRMVEAQPELGENYTPNPELTQPPTTTPKQRGPKKTRVEGSTWEETKTVKKGGKTYKYRFKVTMVNGKRKYKSLGRIN